MRNCNAQDGQIQTCRFCQTRVNKLYSRIWLSSSEKPSVDVEAKLLVVVHFWGAQLTSIGLNCQVSARVQTTLAIFGHLPFQLQSQKRLIQSMISVANQAGQKLRSENQGVSPNTDNFVRLDILGCSLFRAEPHSVCQQSSFAACSTGSSCFTLCSLQYILICKDVIWRKSVTVKTFSRRSFYLKFFLLLHSPIRPLWQKVKEVIGQTFLTCHEIVIGPLCTSKYRQQNFAGGLNWGKLCWS